MENAKPRFVFNCQKCGSCCEKERQIEIFLGDIERWSKDGTIYRVFPYLSLIYENDIPSIQLEKENGKCKMYDIKEKECQIFGSRPIICRAYPLKWDGIVYSIVDVNCLGLNKGVMTQEGLEEIRIAAKKEHAEEERTSTNLPIIHAILLKEIIKNSESEYNKLTEEEKENIEKIFEQKQSENYS